MRGPPALDRNRYLSNQSPSAAQPSRSERLILVRIAVAVGTRVLKLHKKKSQKENTMNRSIALGLAMLSGTVIGATAVNGLHAQNKAPGVYAVLDLSVINSPDVFKTLPSKMGDFDGHTA
jgi:hypothetical protein